MRTRLKMSLPKIIDYFRYGSQTAGKYNFKHTQKIE